MKQRNFLFICVFFVLLFFSVGVSALNGVSPGGYDINFEPGLKKNFDFNFWNDDPSKEFDITVEGDFADFVSLDKDQILGSGIVKVTLNLPQSVATPGKHRILIGAREILKEGSAGGGTVGIIGQVKGVIDIFVPYPGRYGEIDFSAFDSNPGDPVNFHLRIFSRGEESITTNSQIEIYEAGGFRQEESLLSPIVNFFSLSPSDGVDIPKGKLADVLQIGSDTIESGEFIDISAQLDTSKLGSGNYAAVALVTHDGRVVRAEDSFRLGELFIDITDYGKEFERGKINSILISVESFWNEPIENVFITGEVLGYPGITFQTSSIDLKPWSRGTLIGFFDTSLIKENSFQAKLTAYYEGKTTEKIVNLHFIRKTDYVLVGLIIVLIVAGLFFVWVVIDFLKTRSKRGRKRK